MYRLRFTKQRDDAAIMVHIHGPVDNPNSGNSVCGMHKSGDRFRSPAFAEIWNALVNRALCTTATQRC
jgi:hypothetical protein